VHRKRNRSDLGEGDGTLFTINLEPGLVVVERPVSRRALEPEFTDLPAVLLCLGESTNVTPEGIVDHLENFGVHILECGILIFQRDDPRLCSPHRWSGPVLLRGVTLFKEFVIEPPTGIECGIQPPLCDCIWIRPILVGNNHSIRSS